MKVYDSFPFHIEKKNRAIALGFFDGVHLGHQELLKELAEISKAKHLTSTVFTFNNHPGSHLLAEYEFPGLIQTQEMRLETLNKFDVAEVILAPLIPAVTHIAAEDFYFNILCEQFGMQALIVGEDARFGYRGKGNVKLLKEWSKQTDVDLRIVPDLIYNGHKISSTYIRRLIAEGDMKQANQLLGHPFSIKGIVRKGKQLGKTLGFPTINIGYEDHLVKPKFGVYASQVLIDQVIYPSITSIGTNPTVEHNKTIKIESYIYQQNLNLYNTTVYVELLDFVREEIRFPNIDALIDQVMTDIHFVEDFHKKRKSI